MAGVVKDKLVNLGFFAATGIFLGTWEAIAKATGRIPTVSRTAAKHPSMRALAAGWAISLAHHFITHKPD